MKFPAFGRFLLLLFLSLQACATLQTEEDPYQTAWNQRLSDVADENTPKLSLGGTTPSRAIPDTETTLEFQEAHYALPGLSQISTSKVSPEFMQTYPRLVSRAYFRLIAEALDADRDIVAAYQHWYVESHKADNQNDQRVKDEFQLAKKRYEAHRQMLEGLRSWKSFQVNGSDDLEFFLDEQLRASFALFQKGASDQRIVDYLMTELADLYHKEGESMPRS